VWMHRCVRARARGGRAWRLKTKSARRTARCTARALRTGVGLAADARPPLSAFSASWCNLRQRHERLHGDDARTRRGVYLKVWRAALFAPCPRFETLVAPSGGSRWTGTPSAAGPARTASVAVVCAPRATRAEAAGLASRRWSVGGVATVPAVVEQTSAHRHGLMFALLWLCCSETSFRWRTPMSKRRHAVLVWPAAVQVAPA
jgi:hypothetical protein